MKEYTHWKSRAKCQGFTLIELLIVVGIISILAAIAVPNFLEAQIRSKVARTMTDMRTQALAMEAYTVDYNVAPIDSQDLYSYGGNTINNFDTIPSKSVGLGAYWPGKATAGNLNPGDYSYVLFATGYYSRICYWWEKALSTPTAYISHQVNDVFRANREWRLGSGGVEYTNYRQIGGPFFYVNYEHFAKAYAKFADSMVSATNSPSTPRNPFPESGADFYYTDRARVYGIGGYRWALVSAGPASRGCMAQFLCNRQANKPYLGNVCFPSYEPTNGTMSWGYILRTNKGVYKIDTVPAYDKGGYGGYYINDTTNKKGIP